MTAAHRAPLHVVPDNDTDRAATEDFLSSALSRAAKPSPHDGSRKISSSEPCCGCPTPEPARSATSSPTPPSGGPRTAGSTRSSAASPPPAATPIRSPYWPTVANTPPPSRWTPLAPDRRPTPPTGPASGRPLHPHRQRRRSSQPRARRARRGVPPCGARTRNPHAADGRQWRRPCRPHHPHQHRPRRPRRTVATRRSGRPARMGPAVMSPGPPPPRSASICASPPALAKRSNPAPPRTTAIRPHRARLDRHPAQPRPPRCRAVTHPVAALSLRPNPGCRRSHPQ